MGDGSAAGSLTATQERVRACVFRGSMVAGQLHSISDQLRDSDPGRADHLMAAAKMIDELSMIAEGLASDLARNQETYVDDLGTVWKVPTAEAYQKVCVALHDSQDLVNSTYSERNQVVQALTRLYPAGVRRDPIPNWDPEWLGCVYVELPTGQASWHFHDSEAELFEHLPPYWRNWDGHETVEKYRRLAALRLETSHDVSSHVLEDDDLWRSLWAGTASVEMQLEAATWIQSIIREQMAHVRRARVDGLMEAALWHRHQAERIKESGVAAGDGPGDVDFAKMHIMYANVYASLFVGMAQRPFVPTHTHYKGHEYRVVRRDVFLTDGEWQGRALQEGDMMTVYENADGEVFARPQGMFDEIIEAGPRFSLSDGGRVT